MKKGYYLFPTYVKKNEKLSFVGVMNKMQMQVKEFSKWFNIKFMIIYAPDDWTKWRSKVCNKLLFWYSQDREYQEAIDLMKKPDFIYIRKVEADRKYMCFLKKLRKIFPKTKIIVEIPTYPYEKEAYSKWYRKISLLKDRKYRKQYKLYIDRFVIFSNHDIIFGVPTIKTMNGIDMSSIPVIGEKSNSFCDSLNILFIGFMQRQHGLERIIKGLRNYIDENKDNHIRFLFVGDGPELETYRKLANEYNLNRYILFMGKKEGSELDNICNEADIAVSPLGCYKTLTPDTRSSALKTREYLARGLPIITGCIEDIFEQYDCDFHIDFPNDDSDIDIKKVIEWYSNLIHKYGSRENLVQEIRKYSLQHIDNSSTLKPVIDFINSD